MLIRKNTKLFKSIQQLIADCQDRANRDQLIRLYITRAGDTIENRISIEGIQGDAALFYEMTYQTVMGNLKSANHQLHVSDEIPGIYFFHSTSNKVWDETPFEFDEAIGSEFPSLPELPVLRKKEAPAQYVLPSPGPKPRTLAKKEIKKHEKVKNKIKTIVPKQPDFKLKYDVHFTNLDKLVFRQAGLKKQDVLTYYDKIAEYLLPFLKDRPLLVNLQSDNAKRGIALTADGLFKNNDDLIPTWLKTARSPNEKEDDRLLLCNDREHLLLYAEMGCLEFATAAARIKNSDSPDYMLIALDSPESALGSVVDVALGMKDVLQGLQLPSFVKTDGISGLHIYVPLDSKSDFPASVDAARYVCQLLRLKIPELVAMKESGYVHGKVSLDYTLGAEGKHAIAPYSLVAGQSPVVATPISWEEVQDGLRVEDFNHETIFTRLRDIDDPFASLFRKKVDGQALLQRLEENYAFLF